MFDALFAGYIPIILSHDFVWPFTTEILASGSKSILLYLLFEYVLPIGRTGIESFKRIWKGSPLLKFSDSDRESDVQHRFMRTFVSFLDLGLLFFFGR